MDKDKLIDRALEEIVKISRDTFSNVNVTKLPPFEGKYAEFPVELTEKVISVFFTNLSPLDTSLHVTVNIIWFQNFFATEADEEAMVSV